MYFKVNKAFLNYFYELIETLDIPVFNNVTKQEHVLPISLESESFNEELLAAPKMLRTLVERYKHKRISFDKQHDTLTDEDGINSIETSIFDHLAFDIFIFLMAIISIVIIFLVIKLISRERKCKHY